MITTQAKRFTLMALPYETKALAPVISAATVSYHYLRHHQGYVDRLNELVRSTEFDAYDLEDLMMRTAGHAEHAEIFNNAAQVWNHDLYWRSLSPRAGGKPGGDLGRKIRDDFGSHENLVQAFMNAAASDFGSGWVWLVADDSKLKVTKSSNAENPLTLRQGRAILAVDIWEHAYYLDYQNRRTDHVKAVVEKLLNWEWAETRWHSSAGDYSKDE